MVSADTRLMLPGGVCSGVLPSFSYLPLAAIRDSTSRPTSVLPVKTDLEASKINLIL